MLNLVRTQVDPLLTTVYSLSTWRESVSMYPGGNPGSQQAGPTQVVEVAMNGTTLRVFGFRYLDQDFLLAPTGEILKVDRQVKTA